MNLACSGLGINASLESWVALAGNNGLLRDTLTELYTTFQKAPTLGSLIDPARVGKATTDREVRRGVASTWNERSSAEQQTDESRELAIAAKGVSCGGENSGWKVSRLLPPTSRILGRAKQIELLRDYCEEFHYDDAKTDLSTCFVDRCIRFSSEGGTAALVTPQNWLFQESYIDLRKRLLRHTDWRIVVKLGSNAFRDMNFWAATTSLVAITRRSPAEAAVFCGIEVGEVKSQEQKAAKLRSGPFWATNQKQQTSNPDSKITLVKPTEQLTITPGVLGTRIKSGDRRQVSPTIFRVPYDQPLDTHTEHGETNDIVDGPRSYRLVDERQPTREKAKAPSLGESWGYGEPYAPYASCALHGWRDV